MQRLITFTAIVAAISSVGAVLVMKQQVQARAAHVDHIAQTIADDMAAIRVLKAEWAYLSSPERVEGRAVQFLALMPPTPEQMIEHIEDIPFRLPGSVVVPGGSVVKAKPKRSRTQKGAM